MTNSAGPEFVLGGRCSNGAISNREYYGYYWSKSAHLTIDIRSYNLLLGSTGLVRYQDDITKDGGVSLRCLATPTTLTIPP